MFRTKKIVSIFALVALLFTGIDMTSVANATSLTSASDLLSTSDLSVTATHTISFVTGTSTAIGDYAIATLPAGFGNIATSTCSPSYTASGTGSLIGRCIATAPIVATATTMTLVGVTNHANAGVYDVVISTYTSGAVLKETVTVKIAIIRSVVMTASVPSTLTFSISPIGTTTAVNGATTTIGTATTSISFGSLQSGTSSIAAQRLTVTTNADYGYKVTVQQSSDLISGGGSTIDSFKNGVASTTAEAWTSPGATLGNANEYGHMGVTTNDSTLSAGTPAFGSNAWKGFIGISPMEVLSHTGPANATLGVGLADVAYRIEISALQEAGDYTNTLVYVATPTY